MEKKLKQFTFYELYWKLIKNASDKQAGRFALSASRFMFDDVEFDEPQDDMKKSLSVIKAYIPSKRWSGTIGAESGTLFFVTSENYRKKHFSAAKEHITRLTIKD